MAWLDAAMQLCSLAAGGAAAIPIGRAKAFDPFVAVRGNIA
jgi:hypothetical protein